MKLTILVLAYIGIIVADKLPHSYIPPPSNAISAAGGFYIQAPHPTQGYIPPGQIFNSQGQPAVVRIGYGRPPSTTGQQHHHHHHHHHQQDQQPIYQRPQPQPQPQYHQQQHYNTGSYYDSHRESGNPILRYDNINNGDGNYQFDYLTANGISHQEEGHIQNPGTGQQENVVKGSYSYTGPDGKVYTVHYWADSTGFHATGDHLPTPPPVPEAIQRSLASQPQSEQYQHHQSSGGYSHGYQQSYVPPRAYNSGYY